MARSKRGMRRFKPAPPSEKSQDKKEEALEMKDDPVPSPQNKGDNKEEASEKKEVPVPPPVTSQDGKKEEALKKEGDSVPATEKSGDAKEEATEKEDSAIALPVTSGDDEALKEEELAQRPSKMMRRKAKKEAFKEARRKEALKDEDTPRSNKKRRRNDKQEAPEDGDEDTPRPKKRSRKERKEQKAKDLLNYVEEITASSPLLVFAHGAGANSSHAWMVRWKELLREATNAVEVVTFDYPYCANGKKGVAPKAENLVACHKEEIAKAMSQYPGHPLILVGKSMGARVSCMVAGERGTQVAGVVCLGYPLKGANGTLRDRTLLELQAPVLFVQGGKDPMCPLAELEKVRERMLVTNELHVVQKGDHSLVQSKRASGLSQERAERLALEHVGYFVTKISKLVTAAK